MKDLISVIVPVYNVEPYLVRCMKSIIGQTYKNLEIILIDDKSSDRSNEMCFEYKTDDRVVVVHGENKGLSGARNIGLDIAHGKYVVFIDSDDYIMPDMIENLYNCMIRTKADTVMGGFKRVVGNQIIVYKNPFAGVTFSDANDIKNIVLKKMLGYNGIDYLEMSVWRVLFSMDIIRDNELKFPDRKYLCEDIIFDFDYYLLAKKVAMCADTGYCYCLNKDSLSQAYQKNKFERIRFQTSEMMRVAKKIGFDSEAFLRIDNFYIGNLIHHMKTMTANRRVIGQKACVEEFEMIFEDLKVSSVNWDVLEGCFNGRDKIPFWLFKRKNYRLLYVYFCLLTTVRRIIRG